MSVDNITGTLETLSLKDIEWAELHAWVLEIRYDNRLSISSFLHSVGLDPSRNYYRNLVSLMGGKYRPSTRKGTFGQLFRQELTDVKIRGFDLQKSDRDNDFKCSIADWRQDNLEYLHQNSIRDLSVRISDSITDLIINVHELDSNSLTREDLQQKIWQDETISANFEIENVSFRSIKCQMLLNLR